MAKILVIDDDVQLRRLMQRVLDAAGHATIAAANGDVGLQLFRAQRPPLVITDLLMPQGEGIETIRAIRGLAPDTRILAISGSVVRANFPDYLVIAEKLGADATLAKPFTPPELLATVARLLA